MSGRAAGVFALCLAGAASASPGFSAAETAGATAAPGASATLPSGPMVLTRTLRRALPDGNEIVTRRAYEIRFVPEGEGYRIDGLLLSAEAEAPPSLEPLAALERARPDTGLFPMRLDAKGMLREDGTRAAGAPDGAVVQAAQHAVAVIGALGLPGGEARKAQTFADRIGQQGMKTMWPSDLFMPATGQRKESRPVPLPDGSAGTVQVEMEARASQSGLVDLFRRTVTTELAGGTRQTTEIWTLSERD